MSTRIWACTSAALELSMNFSVPALTSKIASLDLTSSLLKRVRAAQDEVVPQLAGKFETGPSDVIPISSTLEDAETGWTDETANEESDIRRAA